MMMMTMMMMMMKDDMAIPADVHPVAECLVPGADDDYDDNDEDHDDADYENKT